MLHVFACIAVIALLLLSPSIAALSIQSATDRLPDRVGLRSEFDARGVTVNRQGARGTCSVFAVAGALEFALTPPKGQATRLSVEFLNWAAHTSTRRTADGSLRLCPRVFERRDLDSNHVESGGVVSMSARPSSRQSIERER